MGKLEQHMADLIQNNLAIEERLDKQGTRLYNLENLNIPHKVSQEVDEIVTDAVDWAMQALLQARFRDLPTVDMKEILQQKNVWKKTLTRLWSSNDLFEAHRSHWIRLFIIQCLADSKASPPPPSTGTSGSAQQKGNWPSMGTLRAFFTMTPDAR
ncbi:hypothetical protein Tco_0739908 [Tanacetum coccineum]